MTYNEAASLPAVLDEIAATLRATGREHEIVVVDDGSDDGSAEIAARAAAQDPAIRLVRHPGNCGLGGVYRTGIEQARNQLLTFFPADGQFPATNLDRLLPHMAKADLALGYVEVTDSLAGRVLSGLERLLYRAAFGRLPRFQGVLMVRVERLRSLPLVSRGRGWAIVMELIVRACRQGWRIESVPNELRPRRHGASKVRNLRSIVANLRQLAELRRAL